MAETDVAIVGAGAAGLSLAHRMSLDASARPAPSVVLITPPAGPLVPPRRTWCYWETGPGAYDAAVTGSWEWLRTRDRHGAAAERRISPMRYKMMRSDDFQTLIDGDLKARTGVRRMEATVDDITALPDGTTRVRAVDADGARVTVDARWAFDSRPPRRLPAARTHLLQHFKGWYLRTEEPSFDPEVVDLMDFRTSQPARGLSFGYVLPTSRRTALVEYTEFGPEPLSSDAYDTALNHYAHRVLGLGTIRVLWSETGVIPMTDAAFPRESAASVFRIGTAGGATRPATGYTFAAIQRQVDAVARSVRTGRRPVPPPAYPARSRMMDAVLLRALATGRVDGPDFFHRLFSRVPPRRLLRFLDGRTHLYEDVAIGLRTPVARMLRTAAELPLVPRRPSPRN
ncbi:lycopene cyclase family protein [Streptomyces sp. NPDC026672]|uniref:lycopene cyclase family protein n=1 Tax=unclassified Streptomyces TaxID=2593676 RepID=UPI0033CD95F3